METPLWATMKSLCGAHTLIPISSALSFGRHPSCTFQTEDRRVSNKHCEILYNKDATCFDTAITCVDTSSNGVFVNGKRLGKGNSCVLHSGDVVALVPNEKSMTFTFTDEREPPKIEEPNEDRDEEKGEETQQIELDTTQEVSEEAQEHASTNSSAATESKIDDQITCGICYGILYKCVTLVPCMHNFCGPCMKSWADARGRAMCPQCRADSDHIRRNHAINNIVEVYLKENPSRQRTAEEIAELEAKGDILETSLRKRRRSSDDGEDEEEDDDDGSHDSELSDDEGYGTHADDGGSAGREQCHGCSVAGPDGYSCQAALDARAALPAAGADDGGGRHVRCAVGGCRGLFPNRPADPARPASACPGCDKSSCGAYWAWTGRPSPPAERTCWGGGGGGLPAAELPTMPGLVFGWGCPVERRRFLAAVTDDGYTPTTLFRHCVEEARAGRLVPVDVPGLPAVSIPELVRKEWLCRECVDKVYASLAFAWALNRPRTSTTPPDCHWGVNCRTQGHNPSHAERYNHICLQTRFT